MKFDNVKTIMVSKRNGTFFKINYRTEVPVKAEFKKTGINLVKFTEKIVRTGINYNNIQAVINKKSSPDYVEPSPKQNNKEWLVSNKLFYNTKTEGYYARFGICNGSKSKTKYVAYDANGNEIEFDKNYARDSYWDKPNKEIPQVFDLKIDNILSIS